MCGIIGYAGVEAASNRDWLAAGRDAMAHRGPDDIGEWWSADGQVGFGHRRLAIIDLSPGGHQPMHDGADLTITFNGEIYNFQELREELSGLGETFRTRSDTEVILKAYRRWGSGFVSRLYGMFALALHDASARKLLLARDRAGEKPLYYLHSGKTLRFSSELKGLFADPTVQRRVDPESLDLYLSMGFVPGERAIIQGISKLPPAHALEFDLASGDIRKWRYWELPGAPADAGASEEELAEELEELLARAVRRQMIADVPIGILLSGGVDSSLVTAMAARAAPRVRTFTVAFPGHDRFDEGPHARLIADHFGTDHEELEAEAASADLLPMLAAQFDEPIIDSSMIPTFLVTRAVRRHCTIALGGDGGDELFAGYGHHSRLAAMEPRARRVPARLRRTLSRGALRAVPDGRGSRNWIRALGVDLAREVPLVACYFDQRARQGLLPGRAGIGRWPDRPWAVNGTDRGEFLDRVIRTDFRTYLPEDILVKVDRAAMRNSLEVRAPFLDAEMLEFAWGKVPVRLKGAGDARKILPKALASKLLPAAFDRQRKQGFTIPLASWLRQGPFRDLFRDVLLASDSVFDRQTVGRLFDGLDRGYRNEERLFGLAQFELWRRHYGISV